MPSPTDSTCPTSATSASLPKLAICCFRMAEISAARISMCFPLIWPSANTLHAQLQALQLTLQRSVDHARADFDPHAAQKARVDANVDRHAAADHAAQLFDERILLHLRQFLRRGDLGGDLAAPCGELRQIGLDHRRYGEEPPVARHNGDEVRGQLR